MFVTYLLENKGSTRENNSDSKTTCNCTQGRAFDMHTMFAPRSPSNNNNCPSLSTRTHLHCYLGGRLESVRFVMELMSTSSDLKGTVIATYVRIMIKEQVRAGRKLASTCWTCMHTRCTCSKHIDFVKDLENCNYFSNDWVKF